MPHAEILQRCMSASDGDIEAAFEAFKYIMSNKLDAYIAPTEAAPPAALAVEANSDGLRSTLDRAERTIERLTAMLEESVQSARSAALSEESPPRDPETGLFVDKTGKNRTHCTYEDGDGCWTVADVVEYVEDHKIPATLCDVRALCDANPATGDESGEDCDPILVVEYTDCGPARVCEGVHRLWKARSEGATKIRAHVITKYELDKIPHKYADPSADGKPDPYQSSMTFPVMHDVAAPMAVGVEPEDNPEERAQLISEILVMLFEDSAIEVADELHHHQGSGHLDDTEETPDTSMAFAPKVTRRYGKRPGPGWTSGGTSRLGTPIWIWGAAPTGGGAPPPTPAPTHAPPPPTPAPSHAPPTPHGPSNFWQNATNPTPHTPTPHAPPTPPPTPAAPAHNLPMATVPPGALGARGGVGAKAASIEAYNQIAKKLNAGQQITNADKAGLAKKLTNMPVDLLRNLHKAFGGTAAVANQKAAVAAVRAHLTGGGTLPTPAPTPTPPPNPLNKGANVISGAPAGPTPGSIAPPQHYQPPPPKLVAAKPYIDTVRGGKTGAAATPFPATIDHNTISGFSNSPSSLSVDFSPLVTGVGYGYAHIGQYNHNPSGYKAIATWHSTGGAAPPTGTPAFYKIQVLDGTGSIVSTYDSQAPRDKAYIEQRLAQVANWMEQEVKKSTNASQPTWSAPLAQFAWDYANAAGVKPGTVPFKIDAASAGDPKNRAAMEGYLKTTFPKLIGAQQHSPHGGMDTIEHTMNILNPLNLRTSGLSNRDAEILRLGMLFHDVGKQYNPKDHDHPRLSAKDAEPMLWQFGLNEREVSDCLAVIKWHDSYGDAMQGRSGYADASGIAKMAYEYTDDTLPPAQRQKEAHRINDLLMRAFQSDVSSIPGLTSKPIPGRPDLTATGFLDVDKSGPAFKAKVAAQIDSYAKGIPPKSLPLPKRPPNASVGIGPKPDLIAKGLKWGELVQRADQLPIGPQVPHGSTIEPPKEVYDEARQNPDLNYARAFNMAYDGPAGSIINVYHGTHKTKKDPKSGMTIPASIYSTGTRPGSNGDNVFGHGVYVVVNGAKSVPSGYSNGATVQMEVHTGRTIPHDDLLYKVLPRWEKAHPTEAKQLGKSSYGYNNSNNEHLTAAALWAGYSSIAVNYSYGNPTLVVIDPSRVRVKNIVDDSNYQSMTVKATQGTITSQSLTPADIKTPVGDVNYVPLKSGVPQAWSGTPRTK